MEDHIRDDGWFPVFQMRLALGERGGKGWIFPDEENVSEDYEWPTFTIVEPARDHSVDSVYGLPVLIGDKLSVLKLRWNVGREWLMTTYEGITIRFSLLDPMTALFSGLRPYPYVGTRADVVQYYSKTHRKFLPLTALDSMAMDRLCLDHRVVLLGVTSKIGPHTERTRPGARFE